MRQIIKQEEQKYLIHIKPHTGWLDVNLKELWRYRDLVGLFIKRNFTTLYKQTILGPLWLVLSPLISTLISTFVFGTIAGIDSEGIPYFIFYMSGNALWAYFAKCLTDTSSTFTGNAAIFGKVYFPRLVVPISNVITGLLNFVIHLAMLSCFWVYYRTSGANLNISPLILLMPILVLQTAMLGMGFGIIISSLTTKYRDLNVLVGFGVSLWMYVTPIIYPVSSLGENIRRIALLNPIAPIIEIFRYAIVGSGTLCFEYWYISWITTGVVLFLGVILFNRTEKTFMDTV